MNRAWMLGALALPALFAAPQPAEAAVWVDARIDGVIDGAHVEAWVGGHRQIIALAGVDVGPLAGTNEAVVSRNYLSSLVLGRRLRIQINSWDLDDEGYLPAYVYLPDETTLVNYSIVSYGYGFYGDPGPFYWDRERFWRAESYAHDRHVAVWAGHRPWAETRWNHDHETYAHGHDQWTRNHAVATRDWHGPGGGGWRGPGRPAGAHPVANHSYHVQAVQHPNHYAQQAHQRQQVRAQVRQDVRHDVRAQARQHQQHPQHQQRHQQPQQQQQQHHGGGGGGNRGGGNHRGGNGHHH